MKGFCECGCGQKTNLARQTNKKWGHVKGEPVRFIRGHQGNLNKYRSGKAKHNCGYEMILVKGHPRADNRGYVPKSILVIEEVMGKYLHPNSIPHHIDLNKTNDNKNNLVVCEDRDYHNLLHRRLKALRECGHATWRKCSFCKQYDDPEALVIGKRQKTGSQKIYHRECRNKSRRECHGTKGK
jgi:hypothetical protein